MWIYFIFIVVVSPTNLSRRMNVTMRKKKLWPGYHQLCRRETGRTRERSQVGHQFRISTWSQKM